MTTPDLNPNVNLNLTEAQTAQQIDLSRRMLHMAYLGTPRVDNADPDMPALLALHALAATYLAIADANPGVTLTASLVAFDISSNLKGLAERRAATAH